MTLHSLTEPPAAWLAAALETFEEQFRYPLGAAGSFRISHGPGYLPFFRAMGAAGVLVAEQSGLVLGTLASVRRTMELRLPGTVTIQAAHYLCDLKVAPKSRGTRVLARLMTSTLRHIIADGVQAAYCVVMDGTGRRPTDYTGRLAVPGLVALGEIMILRLSPGADCMAEPQNARFSSADVSSVHAQWPRKGYTAVPGAAALRSAMHPVPLVDDGGLAAGIVEDTRLGKRLFLASGDEMLSAHLSAFTYATPRDGARLLEQALATALAAGLQALFVSVPRHRAPGLLNHLGGMTAIPAPATVYGHGFQSGHDWWVDPAEI